MNREVFVETYGVERSNSNSVKWLVAKTKGVDDLLPVWIADAEFKTAPEITEAMNQAVECGVFGYTMIPDSYQEAVVNWIKKYSYDIKSEWLRFSTGVMSLLLWAIRAFTNEFDEVLILTPVYQEFPNCIRNAGRICTCFELTNNNGLYSIDFEKLEDYIKTHNIKVFIHCNPHNPIGRVWTIQEQNKLVELMKKYNIYIFADEIHQDLSFKKFIPTAIALNRNYSKRIITLTSNSKTYSIAGCSIAQVVIEDDDLRDKFDKVLFNSCSTPFPTMHYLASEAGYRGCEEWLEGFKETIKYNEKTLRNALEGTGVIMSPLEGTYLAWLDFTSVIEPSLLEDKMLYEAKVLPNFGQSFGTQCLGFIRLNLAISPSVLHEVIKRFKRII